MEVKLPENKVITVKLADENLPLPVPNRYGAELYSWIAYFEMLRLHGYSSFEIDYENSYYDSVEIIYKATRRETDEEVAKRKADESRSLELAAKREREQYEKLKAKFG